MTLTTPTTMANPPTHVRAGGSALSGATHVLPAVGPYRYLGTRCQTLGAAYPADVMYSPSHVAGITPGAFAVEFDYSGQVFEVYTYNTGGSYRLTVAGEGYESRIGPTTMASDGTVTFLRYDFGSAADRTVRLKMSPNMRFGGIVADTANGGVVSAPSTAAPSEHVVVLGDSFTEGTGADRFGLTGYTDHLGIMLDWPDLAPSGLGGTGYVADNGGADVPFGDRLTADVIDAAPDTVVFAGGINDQAVYSAATFQAAVDGVLSATATALPAARLIVLGPWWPTGSPVAEVVQIRDDLASAADTYGATFVDTIGGPVPYSGSTGDYTDTGYITSANAATYISGDGTHPNQDGHDYLALQVATALDTPAGIALTGRLPILRLGASHIGPMRVGQ